MNTYEQMLDVLRGSGWCKKATINDLGQHCLAGAMAVAEGVQPWLVDQAHCDLLNDIVSEQWPERLGFGYSFAFASFNDHPDTTFDDIRVLLEKASVR